MVHHARLVLPVLGGGEADVELGHGVNRGAATLEERDDFLALGLVNRDAGLAGARLRALGLGGFRGLHLAGAANLDAVGREIRGQEFLGGRVAEFGGESLEDGVAFVGDGLGEFSGLGIGFVECGEVGRERRIHIVFGFD